MNSPWIESLLGAMTVEEKVGQIIMVGLYNLKKSNFNEAKRKIIKYHIGGFFHLYATPDLMADFIARLQRDVRIPLLVAADYEIGTGWTLRGGTIFPRPMARGHAGNAETERRIAGIIARQGRSIGTHLTLSPVVDVNTNFQCPDINIRAYGDDPDKIAELAVGFIDGIQENGMLAAVKHFPGNGGTHMDQHICTAVIDASKSEMHDIFLKPYQRAIRAGAAAVVVGHLAVPALCTEIEPRSQCLVPASLSKEIITDVLRGKLGFAGLVITDAMNMGGVNNVFSREEANVKTIQAGADMILSFFPADFERDYDSVLQAVKKGAIGKARLDDAVRHVLTAKAKAGLDSHTGVPPEGKERKRVFNQPGDLELCRRVSEQSLTVIRNGNQTLPIGDIKGKKILVLSGFSPENGILKKQFQYPTPDIITGLLKKRGAAVERIEITSDLSLDEITAVAKKTARFDFVFLNLFIVPSFAIGTLSPNHNILRLFFCGIVSLAKHLIITSFGDPYVTHFFPEAPVYLCTFDESIHSQRAAVRGWLGEIDITGRTPVAFDGFFRRGDGMTIRKIAR